jgi:hypothetical protein
MHDVSMMKIGLCLNNIAARDHDRFSRINYNKIKKVKHDYKIEVNMHA